MMTARILLLGMALATSLTAHAQYQWIDKDGRRVFSDRPPPAEIPAKNVLSQPRGTRPLAPPAGASTAASAPASSPSPAPGAAASGAAPAGVDKALEEKKKKAEDAEAAKKKADDARLAAARADNCKRAMNARASIDSGMRMARTNDKGEREVLDDAQRAEELKRVNGIIAADCK